MKVLLKNRLNRHRFYMVSGFFIAGLGVATLVAQEVITEFPGGGGGATECCPGGAYPFEFCDGMSTVAFDFTNGLNESYWSCCQALYAQCDPGDYVDQEKGPGISRKKNGKNVCQTNNWINCDPPALH